MKPVRCPTCQLQWNIPDEAPAIITCPRCLAALNNPYSTAPAISPSSGTPGEGRGEGSFPRPIRRPPPLPIARLERQVQTDTRAANAGLILIVLVVIGGTITFFIAVANGFGPGIWGTLALLVIAAAAVIPIVLVSKKKPAIAPAIPMAGVAPTFAPRVQPGGVLEYSRPAADPRKLSPGKFFAQTIGGIILGIVGGVTLMGFFSGVANGAFAMIGVFGPVALGAFLCAKPQVRGLGVGLILAIPVALVLLLGFCAILIGSGGLNFH